MTPNIVFAVILIAILGFLVYVLFSQDDDE
jgi:hypothetical protein